VDRRRSRVVVDERGTGEDIGVTAKFFGKEGGTDEPHAVSESPFLIFWKWQIM